MSYAFGEVLLRIFRKGEFGKLFSADCKLPLGSLSNQLLFFFLRLTPIRRFKRLPESLAIHKEMRVPKRCLLGRLRSEWDVNPVRDRHSEMGCD